MLLVYNTTVEFVDLRGYTLNTVCKTEWKKIELSDREVFEKYGKNKEGIAMFSFASMFFWRDFYQTSYMIVNDNVVVKGVSEEKKEIIYFPRGVEGSIKEILDVVKSNSEKMPMVMPITEEIANKIKEDCINAKVELIDGKCEYVYNQSDLANLAGKKYHSKRNHISKFDKKYDSEYINITEENIALLRECAEYMFNLIENSPVDEFKAIMSAIDNFTELKLRACVIVSDGKFVAYSIGSSINQDCADIHFEKADRSFDGSYAKVNNSFAKYGFADKKFLNREEDLGIEGLRKAKLSYYPCKLNQMYKAELF